jgi:hypothetical protein
MDRIGMVKRFSAKRHTFRDCKKLRPYMFKVGYARWIERVTRADSMTVLPGTLRWPNVRLKPYSFTGRHTCSELQKLFVPPFGSLLVHKIWHIVDLAIGEVEFRICGEDVWIDRFEIARFDLLALVRRRRSFFCDFAFRHVVNGRRASRAS